MTQEEARARIAALEAKAPPPQSLSPSAYAKMPEILKASEFRKSIIVRPPEIIKGVLTQGARMVLAGPSKSRKSWVLLDLAYSVAAGKLWLGLETTPARVLYTNFELRNHTIHSRINQICKTRKIENDELLDLWDLRGWAKSIDEMVIEIKEVVKGRDPYGMIILDPTYKLLGARDENSAGEMTEFCGHLEWLAQETGAAIVAAAHFPKGSMAVRVSQDRIAGSGAFARDADAILTMNPHAESTDACPVYSIESTLREFAPIEPFVVRWNYPVMEVDPLADPADIAGKAGRKQDFKDEEFLKYLTADGITKSAWRKEMDEDYGITKSTFYRRVAELEEACLVREDPDTGLMVKGVDPASESVKSALSRIKAKRTIGGKPVPNGKPIIVQ
jgi:hypothetical protein